MNGLKLEQYYTIVYTPNPIYAKANSGALTIAKLNVMEREQTSSCVGWKVRSLRRKCSQARMCRNRSNKISLGPQNAARKCIFEEGNFP